MKTVGVVIPIYNVEKYLRECLDSVVNQTYKNLQVVLVNDGSTDENSLNIAKEYTLKDERFILFDKENGGLSSARNVGIEFFSKEYDFKNITQELKENSLVEFKLDNEDNPYNIYKIYKSSNFFKNKDELLNFKAPDIDYIIFLDSDDYWELNCIEECVPRMDGVEVVWFDNKAFDYEIKTIYPTSKTFMECFSYNIKNKQINGNTWFDECRKNNITSIWIAVMEMIDFAYLKTLKLKFLDGVLYEDNLFGTLLFLNAKKLYVLDKKLYNNRIRANSIMCHDNNLSFENLAPFFRILSNDFLDPYDAKEYIKLHSWTCMTFVLLLIYVNKFKNKENLEKIRFFLFSYKDILFENIKLNQDPWAIKDKIDIINFFVNNKLKDNKYQFNTNLYGTAKQRIQNQLCYKLGQTMIINSKSIIGILFMPIYLLSTFLNYKQDQKIYYQKIKKDPTLKLPPLENYPDYQEALKYKEHLSYKLGKILLESFKTWHKGGLFRFP
ncbi:glycosyltransferase family 2 protein, partial [Campylobacter jejuni]|uniref:glycosyltransferase family 2 protein n=1 Tax=Campylobacter jejuni TaxID=197 RepID=UPI0009AAC35B